MRVQKPVPTKLHRVTYLVFPTTSKDEHAGVLRDFEVPGTDGELLCTRELPTLIAL